MLSKKQLLHELAEKRRNDRWPGYSTIADFHGGIYECDYVSPYTKSAHNLNARIFVMMQDWSSSDSLARPICWDSVNYGYTRRKGSNINLQKLLQEFIGITLPQTYATNLFPFIKPGSMSASIPHSVMKRAAVEYGLPQIRIIRPKLVICFGISTFNGLRTAIGLPKVTTVKEGIGNPFPSDGADFWLQVHPAQQAQNSRGKMGVASDWLKMRTSVTI